MPTNTCGHTREVMTIIYIDKEMLLAAPENRNQQMIGILTGTV